MLETHDVFDNYLSYFRFLNTVLKVYDTLHQLIISAIYYLQTPARSHDARATKWQSLDLVMHGHILSKPTLLDPAKTMNRAGSHDTEGLPLSALELSTDCHPIVL